MNSTGSWRVAIAFGVLLGLVLCVTEVAADQIIMRDGNGYRNVEIASATYETVSFKPKNVNSTQSVPADKVEELVWETSNYSLGRAVRALENGDLAEALKRATGAKNLAQGPSRGFAVYLPGEVLLAQGAGTKTALDAAVTAFEEHLKEFEKDKDFYVPRSLRGIAQANIQLKQYAQARQAYEKLKTFKGAFGLEGELGLAKVLIEEGKFADARAIFGRLRNDGNLSGEVKAEAHLGYAQAQHGQQQYQPAAETLAKMLATSAPRSQRLRPVAARAYALWGDCELELAGTDKEKLQWASIRFMRAAALSGNDRDLYVRALEGAQKTFEKLGDKGRVEDLKQRIATAK